MKGEHIIRAEAGYWRLFFTKPDGIDRFPVIAWFIEDVADEEDREAQLVACAILPFEAHLAANAHRSEQPRNRRPSALKTPHGIFDENGGVFADEVDWILWEQAIDRERAAETESGDQDTREETRDEAADRDGAGAASVRPRTAD